MRTPLLGTRASSFWIVSSIGGTSFSFGHVACTPSLFGTRASSGCSITNHYSLVMCLLICPWDAPLLCSCVFSGLLLGLDSPFNPFIARLQVVFAVAVGISLDAFSVSRKFGWLDIYWAGYFWMFTVACFTPPASGVGVDFYRPTPITVALCLWLCCL